MTRAFSAEELASETGVDADRVAWLASIGILRSPSPGRFSPGDAFRQALGLPEPNPASAIDADEESLWEVENEEQGLGIWTCRVPRAALPEVWRDLRHYG